MDGCGAGFSWRAPAWLAEARGGLASIVLPAGCRLCEQLLTGYPCARIAWLHFRAFEGAFAEGAEFRSVRCLAIRTVAGRVSCLGIAWQRSFARIASRGKL